MRQFGPFNVDRAPTGQLVPKGTVEDPVNKYPDSKTKYQKSGLDRDEYAHRRTTSGGRQRKQDLDGNDENDEDYDENEEGGQTQQRSGRYQ